MIGRREFTITKVQRSPEGYWQANVTPAGADKPIRVDRRFGSWQVPVNEVRRDVLPHVAAALQEKVRPADRKEQKAKEIKADDLISTIERR